MLSCQRLYMGYNNARSQLGNATTEPSSSDEEWRSGEPPLSVESQQVEQLFSELREEAVGADVLVLEDREWMQDSEFSEHVKRLLREFLAHGGEVRYSTNNSKKLQEAV